MNIGNGLKAAKTVVTSKAGRTLLKGQKHSPTILFGAGVIGVVATAVMASRATLRLEEILDEHEVKLSEAHEVHEIARIDGDPKAEKNLKKDTSALKVRMCKDVARLYAPTIIVGAATIGSMGGSHYILNNRLAGVTAAFAMLDKGMEEYRARVRDLVGDEKERELRFGAEEQTISTTDSKGNAIEKKAQVVKVPHGCSPYARLFSRETSPNSWNPQPEYNLVFLRAQQTYANDMLRAKGHVFLNEIYDALGLERSQAGAVTGWVWNNKRDEGDNRIDFGIFDNPDRFHDFVTGREGAILLDFNVDGLIYDLI